jgi:hypothetical protein
MSISTTRKLTLRYAATLLGAMAIVALAPGTAHATDNTTGLQTQQDGSVTQTPDTAIGRSCAQGQHYKKVQITVR